MSRTHTISRRKNWDLHLESSRSDLKISAIQTLQHSKKHPSTGPCAWKKWQGHQLGHCTRTRTKFQVRSLRIDNSPNQVPRTMFLHVLQQRRKRKHSLWTRELHFMMSKSELIPEEQDPIQQSKDPSIIMTANGTTHTTQEATVICL